MSKIPETSKITIYETEDGKARIEVRFEHENVWLTQKLMAELFECTIDNVSLHLCNIYESGELSEDATTEKSSVVQYLPRLCRVPGCERQAYVYARLEQKA